MADRHQVFITYPHEHGKIAQAIFDELTEAGFSCWMAPGSIPAGTTYASSITEAIENSRVMVLVFAASTNESEHCESEVEIAHGSGVEIVPFRIEEVEPNKAFRYYLSKRQWLDAFSGRLEDHIPRLREAVRDLIEEPKKKAVEGEPKKALVRPRRASMRRAAIGGGALLLIAVIAVAVWQLYPARDEAPALELPDKPSIAVLPFKNLSADPEQEYFSDAITEDIIAGLSRFDRLFVVASNSVFAYKGKPTNVQQVGRELGVRYVLEGSVQMGADRVRITAQVVDATNGQHVWAEQYERELKDFFAIQSEVVGSIVGTLGAYGGPITEAEVERAMRKAPGSLQAYEYVVLADKYFDGFNKEDMAKAGELFEAAVELDPYYAYAIAGVAWADLLAYEYQWVPDLEAALERGFEFAKKAVAADDWSVDAHWVLGYAYLMKGEHERALAEYERAFTLNPNDADLMADMGYVLTYVGRADEGLSLVEKAMRRNPFYPDWYLNVLGMALYTVHQYEEAVAALKRITDLWEQPTLFLAASYAQSGRLEEAQAEMEQILEQHPESTVQSWSDSSPFADQADAEHFFDGLRKAGLPE